MELNYRMIGKRIRGSMIMKKKENLFLTELALNAFLPFDDGEELSEEEYDGERGDI